MGPVQGALARCSFSRERLCPREAALGAAWSRGGRSCEWLLPRGARARLHSAVCVFRAAPPLGRGYRSAVAGGACHGGSVGLSSRRCVAFAAVSSGGRARAYAFSFLHLLCFFAS